MFYRKDAAVALAVCSLLASAGFASAADTAAASPTVSFQPTVLTMDDAAASQGLMMQGLDRLGVGKPMNSMGLNFTGYIDAGYIYNPNRSSGEGNTDHVFTFNNNNNFLLNQIELAFGRNADFTGKKFDVGFKVEAIYGTDARYIHAFGESLYDTDSLDSPYAQFDFPQYYVDATFPVFQGLRLRAGKFVSLIGYETINPTTNPFYTHSILFNFSGPFTESGALASANFSDQLSASLGFARGDDVSYWKDNNGSVSFIGQVGYTPVKNLQLYFNFDVGPEPMWGPTSGIGSNAFVQDSQDWRQIYNIVATYAITDQWSVAADMVVACEHLDDNTSSDNWYGIALYTGYKINDYVTANGRAEWFMDRGGQRLSNPGGDTVANVLGTSFRGQENLWEVTLGVTISPMPKDNIGKNIKIRPEVRYDTADDQIYSGGSNNHQVTIAADVIFTF